MVHSHGPKIQEARLTGEWWHAAMWAFEDFGPGTPPLTERQHALTVLREAFPAYWFLDNCSKAVTHPLCHSLVSGGTLTAAGLVELARDWEATSELRFVQGVEQRLRDSAEYEGARFELETANFFLQQGFNVEFLSSTTGEAMPDLHIVKDEVELFVEAKTLRDSQIRRLERELYFRLWSDPTLQSLPVLVSLKLGESMLDLLYGLHGPEAQTVVAAIAQYLVDEIRHQHDEKRAPSRRSIKDYAECQLEPLVGNKTGGVISMHSPSPSPGYELNRVIRNTIPDAAMQLPRSKPSVVAVQVSIGFDFDMGEAMLHKLLPSLKDRYGHVVGVFLVGERLERKPFRQLHVWRFVRNEASDYPASYLRSVERIR